MPTKVFTPEMFSKIRVVYFNRILAKTSPEELQKLKAIYNIKVVMDLDDYWYLYPTHYLYKTWMASNVPDRTEKFMRIADVITCTTERLASKIRPINDNIHVLPNATPLRGQFLPAEANYTPKGTRFGFVGGTSHLGDLRIIAPVFQTFSQLDFTLAGYTGRGDSEKMRNTCSNYGKNLNFKTTPMIPLDKYMEAYNSLDCCIAPLMEEDFNAYKSNLKVIEAGSKRCALICSPNKCYTDTVPDDVVTYCKSIKDWKEAIRKHQDIGYTKERGEKLYNWVKANYSLTDVNVKRLDLLKSLIPHENNMDSPKTPATMLVPENQVS
jgi:hypothetical protein